MLRQRLTFILLKILSQNIGCQNRSFWKILQSILLLCLLRSRYPFTIFIFCKFLSSNFPASQTFPFPFELFLFSNLRWWCFIDHRKDLFSFSIIKIQFPHSYILWSYKKCWNLIIVSLNLTLQRIWPLSCSAFLHNFLCIIIFSSLGTRREPVSLIKPSRQLVLNLSNKKNEMQCRPRRNFNLDGNSRRNTVKYFARRANILPAYRLLPAYNIDNAIMPLSVFYLWSCTIWQAVFPLILQRLLETDYRLDEIITRITKSERPFFCCRF